MQAATEEAEARRMKMVNPRPVGSVAMEGTVMVLPS